MTRQNKVLVVMPTRGRPAAALEALASVVRTASGYADILLCVDPDDPARIEVNTARITTQVMARRMPVAHILNEVILQRLHCYEIFGFTGDDALYLTPGWDVAVWNILKHKTGLVYGEDGIQNERLPTHPWFSRAIVQALGYVFPPAFTHYYVDNFLKAIAEGIGGLVYRPDIRVKHRHHSVAGGLPMDRTYSAAERGEPLARHTWSAYGQGPLQNDIEKVKTYLTAVLTANPINSRRLPPSQRHSAEQLNWQI